MARRRPSELESQVLRGEIPDVTPRATRIVLDRMVSDPDWTTLPLGTKVMFFGKVHVVIEVRLGRCLRLLSAIEEEEGQSL